MTESVEIEANNVVGVKRVVREDSGINQKDGYYRARYKDKDFEWFEEHTSFSLKNWTAIMNQRKQGRDALMANG